MPRFPTRFLAQIAFSLGLVIQIACTSTPANPIEDTLKSFAGSWKVTSLNRSGKASDGNDLKEMSVNVEGDKFNFVELSGPDTGGKPNLSVRIANSEEYVLQLNPAKPGEIDFVHIHGEKQGKTRPGLYQLEGTTLRICLAAVGNARPTQIAPGGDIAVFVLERQP